MTSARNDVIAGAVTIMAIVLFVQTGARAMIDAVERLFYAGGGSDRVAMIALFLNIALILFAWRRYKDLRRVMSEQAAASERARTLASRDQLTNLLLRGAMVESTDAAVRQAMSTGQSVAMLVVSLDRFKKVNEVYGHLAGDSLLRSAADLITVELPGDALCARLGGDEFAVALPFNDREADVNHLAEKLVRRLEQPFEIAGVPIQIGASVGIAHLTGDCPSSEALLRCADIAMNAAKKSGGGRVVVFDNSMESVLRARNEVEAGLRRGIPLGEFVPFYQQQIDLTTGRIRGFEALARWAHPTGGIVDPDIFIPVAEETGLIGILFESLFRQALQDAHGWDSSITLAVNISPSQLKDPLLAHKILKLLTESGFPAGRLEVEITETALFENLAVAQSIVASLKNHGAKLALDDFGTGYSSLAHLRALPFDRIKIDRGFVQAMNKDPESLAIVKAVTMMGESLGVAVTAEGIEDAETAERVRSIGCDKGQGWLYGRPLSGEDARDLLGRLDLLAFRTTWNEGVAHRGSAPKINIRSAA